MWHVSEAVELVLVVTMVFVGLAGLYFVQRWMDKDKE